MVFKCKECNKEIEIHKVRLSYIDHDLVCKEAYCCSQYMEHVITDEYKGMPEIKRNDSALEKGDKLWNDFKHDNTE